LLTAAAAPEARQQRAELTLAGVPGSSTVAPPSDGTRRSVAAYAGAATDDAGMLVVHLIDITNFKELENQVVQARKMQAVGQQVVLKITHGRDLGLVRVDQSQFEQVIINLAVNARDAMPAGGSLTVRTSNVAVTEPVDVAHETMPPGDYVRIEVIDSGTGIP